MKQTTRSRLSLLTTATLVGCLMAMACTEEVDTASGEGGSGAEGGGQTADGSLRMQVMRVPPVPSDDFLPAAGALVAVDLPRGERVELTADDDGVVEVESVDWSLGTAAVTAYLPDHALGSLVGIDGSDEELEMLIGPLTPAERVTVSGTAQNLADDAHWLEVGATANGLGQWGNADAGPDWSIEVVPDTPFTIVAREITYEVTPAGTFDNPIYGWLVSEQEGVSDATTITLDFGMSVTANTVSGSFPMITREDSPLRTGNPFGFVVTQSSVFETATIGRGRSSSLSEDGSTCSYTAELIDIEATEPITALRIIANTATSSVYLWGETIPSGSQDVDFLDVVQLPSSSKSKIHGLHETLEWEQFDDDAHVDLHLFRRMGPDMRERVWVVSASPGASSVTVPLPPSNVDTESLFGVGTLIGELWTTRTRDPDGSLAIAAEAGPARVSFQP